MTRLDQIFEIFAKRRKEGFEPRLILVNPKVHSEIMKETGNFMEEIALRTFFGNEYIITPNVTDFIVVDNRSWVYQ